MALTRALVNPTHTQPASTAAYRLGTFLNLHEIGSSMKTVTTWREAEYLAAEHMRLLGFDDADVTQLGADGGIDVRSDAAVAQVKHYAAPVGSPAVQQLRGATPTGSRSLFYSLTGYTAAARAAATAAGVALFGYTVDGNIHPVNELAAEYATVRHTPVKFATNSEPQAAMLNELAAYAQTVATTATNVLQEVAPVLLAISKEMSNAERLDLIAKGERLQFLLDPATFSGPIGEVVTRIGELEGLSQYFAELGGLDFRALTAAGTAEWKREGTTPSGTRRLT